MSSSLVEILHRLPDPRKSRGRSYSLVPILSLTIVATLAGCNSLQAIAQFGHDHGLTLAHALGFRSLSTPSASTLSRLFRALDVEAFEALLQEWILQRCDDLGEHLSLDGKVLRGSHDGQTPGTHLLSLFAPKVQAVVRQIRVQNSTNEHKAALELLGVVPIEGKIISGDAIFCQTDITQAITDAQADYILHVKDNQPTLRKELEELLDASASFSPNTVA